MGAVTQPEQLISEILVVLIVLLEQTFTLEFAQ